MNQAMPKDIIMPSILCSNHRILVAELVRACDQNSEGPGSNPGWICCLLFSLVLEILQNIFKSPSYTYPKYPNHLQEGNMKSRS